jgi:hypothetical protein
MSGVSSLPYHLSLPSHLPRLFLSANQCLQEATSADAGTALAEALTDTEERLSETFKSYSGSAEVRVRVLRAK